MAISLYIGVPGSGKSYEVVKSVILPAIAQGRRVITNIKGINESLIHDYCFKYLKCQAPGSIVPVDSEDILSDNFFPYYPETEEEKIQFSNNNTICEYGDLICLDEIWSVWPSDSSVSEAHKKFISMHRHMSHESTGVSCDLIIINQGTLGIPRYLKERIEFTYRMTKLKSLGLRQSYRVDVFSRVKETKTNKVNHFVCVYDKNIFPLYQSYEGVNGTEAVTDARQNIFSSKWFWIKVGLCILLLIASIYALRNAWASLGPVSESHSENVDSPVSSAKEFTDRIPEVTSSPVLSSTWKIAGELKSELVSSVILVHKDGSYRVLPANIFTGTGFSLNGIVDGESITYYSGK